MKLLIPILAILLLTTVAAGPQTLPVSPTEARLTTQYTPQYYQTVAHVGTPVDMEIRSSSELKFTDFQLIINPYNGTYLSTAKLYVECLGMGDNVSLGDNPNWGTYNLNGTYILLSLNAGAPMQTIRFPDEEANVKYATRCTFKAYGEDLWLSVVLQPKYTNSLDSLFTVPDNGINQIIQRTKNTLFAGFDVIKVVIMAVAFILFVFLIVFVMKTFMYFVSRLRGKK